MILPSDSPDAEIVLAHDAGKQVALGRALVALSALAWSSAGIFTKGVEADVWTVLLWRGLLAGGVMSAWLVWRRGQAGLSDWKHLGWAGWSAATVSSAATICFIAACTVGGPRSGRRRDLGRLPCVARCGRAGSS